MLTTAAGALTTGMLAGCLGSADTGPTDEGSQPEEILENSWFYRDAWCISVTEQTYIVTDDRLVSVRETPETEGRQ